MGSLFKNIFFKSEGLKRSLAILFGVLSMQPELAVYNEWLIRLAGFFGVSGVAGAFVKNVNDES